jgi:hypothetical protein
MFAMAALMGIAGQYNPEATTEIADWCYSIADAMLKARSLRSA